MGVEKKFENLTKKVRFYYNVSWNKNEKVPLHGGERGKHTMEKYLVLATFAGSIIALLFAFFTGKRVLSFDEGTPLMSKISRSIREGANAYLKRR